MITVISSRKLGVPILMQHSAPDKSVIIINVPFRKYTTLKIVLGTGKKEYLPTPSERRKFPYRLQFAISTFPISGIHKLRKEIVRRNN